MKINHNISAIKANMHLNKSNTKLDKSLERLSSGLKINRAADDAAGMAISQKMRTQIAGLDRASNNASDGISVIQTAEGALSEVGSMLQRMRELAVQASNGSYTLEDRQAVQKEVDQLKQEITRISETTEFNTKKLLNGDIDRKSYSSDSKINIVALSDSVAVGQYQVKLQQLPTQTKYGASAAYAIPAGGVEGRFCMNGEEVEIKKTDNADDIFEKLRNLGDSMNIDVTRNAGKLEFTSREYGSSKKIEIHCSNDELANALKTTPDITATPGQDAKLNLVGFPATTTMSNDGKDVTITDRNGFSMKIEVSPDAVLVTPPATQPTVNFDVLSSGPMILQIGANEGQTMEVRIPEVTPKTLGIESINLTTQDGAEEAISKLDEAVNQVSAIRAKLGAYQNRLEHSIANLDTTGENMTDALSRIEDTDMAEEMAQFTQMQVLSQAGTSMLSQANQRPQTILSLLQG